MSEYRALIVEIRQQLENAFGSQLAGQPAFPDRYWGDPAKRAVETVFLRENTRIRNAITELADDLAIEKAANKLLTTRNAEQAAILELIANSAQEGLADCDEDCDMSAFWVLQTIYGEQA